MIRISKEAESKINEVLKNNPNKIAKIILKKGGCAGTILALVLDNENSNDDFIVVNNLRFAISKEAKNYINDISIEVKNSLGTEIIIKNLRATTCKCGKSFKI